MLAVIVIKIYSLLLRNRFSLNRLLYSFFFFQICGNKMGEKNCNPCEQFVLLAKTAKVGIPPLFPLVFSCPNIKSVSNVIAILTCRAQLLWS